MATNIVARLSLDAAGFNRGLAQAEKGAKGFGGKLKQIGTASNALLGAAVFAGITKGFVELTKAAVAFESAFAGVRKTVNATEAEFSRLADTFTDLSTTIPVSREELSSIGEIAGQLGVTGVDNISKFVDTIARIATSTNLTTEQAATDFARFANVTGLPLEKVDQLGAAIVALGNNFATTEADITSMASRLAGAGTVVGLSEADILGLATALSSVGIEAQAGGTAFSKVLIAMSQAAAEGGDAAADLAAQVGLTVEGFQTLVQTDPATALETFIASLKASSDAGENLFAILDSLGFTEIRLRDALLKTAGAGDLVATAIKLSNEAFEENTALVEESEKRFGTTESRLTVLSNTFSVLSGEIGAVLLPALQDLTNLLVPLIKGIISWAQENPTLVKSLLAMAGVVAAGGALVVGIAAMVALFAVLGAVGSPLLLTIAAITALVGVVVSLRDLLPDAIKAIQGFFDALAKGLADKATIAVNAVADILDGISEFLNELPERAFRAGIALVDEFAKGLASRAQAAVDAVGDMVGKVRDLLPFSPAKEGPLSDLDEAGVAFGETFAKGIRDGGDAPVQAAEDVVGRVRETATVNRQGTRRPAAGREAEQALSPGVVAAIEGFELVATNIKQTMSTMVEGVLLGTQTISEVWRNFWQNTLLSLMNSGIQSIIDSLIDALKRAAIQAAATQSAQSSGGGGGFFASLLGAFGGGGTTGGGGSSGILAAQSRGAANPALFGPGFQHGGSFLVNGPGGTDRVPVRFMATRGERVTVDPVGASRGGTTINIVNQVPEARVNAKERTLASGSQTIDILVENIVETSMRKGRLGKSMERNFNIARTGRVG